MIAALLSMAAILGGTCPASCAPVVPAGTEVTVKLLEAVDSGHGRVGQVVPAVLQAPIRVHGQVLAYPGARVRVRLVQEPDYVRATAPVYALELAAIHVGGEWYPVTSGYAETTAEIRQVAAASQMPESTANTDEVLGGLAQGEDAMTIEVRGAGVAVQVLRGPELHVSKDVAMRFTLAEFVELRSMEE